MSFFGPYQEADESNTLPAFYLRYTLILHFYLRLGLPGGLFPSDFPATTLYDFVYFLFFFLFFIFDFLILIFVCY
jgi:hypothetical protein